MRICILTHTFPRFPSDVAAPFMYGVAKSLVDSGNEVFVLIPFSPKFSWAKKTLPFKLVTYKYIYPDSLHKLGYSETLTNDMGLPFSMWLLSPFMYFSAMFALFNLVTKEKIDLINAHWILPNGFIASVVSLFTGTPVVSTLPGSDVHMVKKNILFNLLGRFATWKSTWVTSNSMQLIYDLQAATGINLVKKSSMIIYGVDTKKFYPTKFATANIKNKLDIGKDNLVVLSVGRLVEKKGFEYLIRAAKSLSSKVKNIKYIIIGDGDQKDKLEALTRSLGVSSSILFPGWVNYEDLVKYYNLSDVYILPSVRDSEGNLDDQSVSVVEAMACGAPVITSDFPGYAKVIINGFSGYLVREKDVAGIADKILTLVKSNKLRANMGKAARKEVLKHFTWQAIGKQYTSLFEKLNKKYYSIGVPKIQNESQRLKKAKQIYNVLKVYLKQDMDTLNCLDVGSSTGEITNYLADYFRASVGVDVDRFAIDSAKNKFKKKNLTFKSIEDENLDFNNNSFNVVICNQVYNFVEDPEKLMAEIYRVLTLGGVCFFGARNRWALVEPQYNLPFGSWFPALLPFGKNYMSYFEIKKLVRMFEVNDVTVEILRTPSKFGFKSLEKYAPFAQILPLKLFEFLIPNYIFILRKQV